MACKVLLKERNVDNFAGGGGATVGMEWSGLLSIDVAINHNPKAMAMHKANHPHTDHKVNDVWGIDPVEVADGHPIGVAWFSPDCKHFSKAKGGKPVEKNVRDLAWVVIKWGAKVHPRIIALENVEEFLDWGPLDKNNKPLKALKGETFKQWKTNLESLGYVVEYRILKACDYGAPTIRKRLYTMARLDGHSIVWPEPTHGEGLLPYKTAADCIDWSIPCPSVFFRPNKRTLADNTLRRIVKGLEKFVFEHPDPFFIEVDNQTLAPYTTRICQSGRVGDPSRSINEPVSTIVTKNEHLIVAPMLVSRYGSKTTDTETASTSHVLKLRNGCHGHDMREPLHTITSGGQHFGEVRSFLVKYYGTAIGQDINTPLHSVTTKNRFGLIDISTSDFPLSEEQRLNAWWVARLVEDFGKQQSKPLYPHPRPSAIMINDSFLVDILMRMFEPRELFTAQGFRKDYKIDATYIDENGKERKLTKADQHQMVGNSVCPIIPKLLMEGNLAEQHVQFNMILDAKQGATA